MLLPYTIEATTPYPPSSASFKICAVLFVLRSRCDGTVIVLSDGDSFSKEESMIDREC